MMMQPLSDAAERLATLEARILAALNYLGEPPAPWMRRRAGTTHDVIIVGAGQAGLAIGFALKREGIDSFVLLDARPAVKLFLLMWGKAKRLLPSISKKQKFRMRTAPLNVTSTLDVDA